MGVLLSLEPKEPAVYASIIAEKDVWVKAHRGVSRAKRMDKKPGQLWYNGQKKGQMEEALHRALGGAVLTQWMDSDAELKEISGAYDTSQGRASLMRSLIAENPALTYQALSDLSVQELALVLVSRRVKPEGIAVSGTINQGQYLDQAAAREIALAYAGVVLEAAREMEIEMDMEGKMLVYSVEFIVDDIEHEYGVDALSGWIVEWKIKWKDATMDN